MLSLSNKMVSYYCTPDSDTYIFFIILEGRKNTHECLSTYCVCLHSVYNILTIIPLAGGGLNFITYK